MFRSDIPMSQLLIGTQSQPITLNTLPLMAFISSLKVSLFTLARFPNTYRSNRYKNAPTMMDGAFLMN
jgi:hypothetical protein